MPDINESTPRSSIVIAGETFTVPQPYGAGHVLTSNEASAMNQVFAENVRNNLASKVKALKEAGTFASDVFQGTVDDYTNDYEFGQRTGGGRSGDPVQAEAMSIARDLIRQAISKAYARTTPSRSWPTCRRRRSRNWPRLSWPRPTIPRRSKSSLSPAPAWTLRRS
jgi:hypothetical protein